MLQLTNPFLKLCSLRKSLNKLKKNPKFNSLLSITESTVHPFLFVNLEKNIRFEIFKLNNRNFFTNDRSQDSPKSFVLSGALKITKTNFF